jgi:recombination protein RecT
VSNAGPPPVQQSRAVTRADQAQRQASVAEQNYLTIVDTLKQNNGAEAKAVRAMFGGDKQLADKFLAVAFSMLASNNDLLLRATPMSVIQAIKDAASLGLEPMTSDGAIILYGDQAKFMPMYRGYVKRILRSGSIIAVDAKAVMTEDEFDYWTTGNGTDFIHHPAKALKDPETGDYLQSRGQYKGFYAYARTRDGFTYFIYRDVDWVNGIRDRYGYTGKPDAPWLANYEPMGLKTVIRELSKLLPQESVAALEQVEAKNDEAMATLRRVDDGMDEVRQLALRAVGAGPTDVPQEPAASAAPAGTPPEEKPAQPPPPEPGPATDPNVAAAMALNEEQEQLRRQRRG